MPPKGKYRKKKKRSSTYRKLKWKPLVNPRKGVIKTLVVPDGQYVRLPMTARFTLNPAAGGSDRVICSANDLYDPTLNTGAYQPLGFDQWMAFYTHFTVWRSSIKITLLNSAASVCWAGIKLRPSSTAVTDFEEFSQHPKGPITKLTGTGGSGTTTLRYGHKMSTYFGRSVLNDDIFRGTVSSSPSELAYYHISVHSIDGTNDPGDIYGLVEIVYDVYLHERKNLTESQA